MRPRNVDQNKQNIRGVGDRLSLNKTKEKVKKKKKRKVGQEANVQASSTQRLL